MNKLVKSIEYRSILVSLIHGDITEETSQAIVNSANPDLYHKKGVSAAIVKKGGRDIINASNKYIYKYGEVPIGDVVTTESGFLKKNNILFVIHAVGPFYDINYHDKCEKLLAKSIFNSLYEAEKNKCESISIPPISSGNLKYPKDECAKTILKSIFEFIEKKKNLNNGLKKINITILDELTLEFFKNEFEKIEKFLSGNKIFVPKPQNNIVCSFNYLSFQILLSQGDITEENTEAIVNAANNQLWHGAGVAGAIANKCGKELVYESHKYVQINGEVETGKVATTTSGNLKINNINYVIHAVGPIYNIEKHEKCEKLLKSAFLESLMEAEKLKCKSISIPPISSGIYGYPKEECAKALFDSIFEFINMKNPEEVFCIYFLIKIIRNN